MLAQNFKSAADLGISEVELDALIKVLGMLERGEIGAEHFDMQIFERERRCGTVGCICGWANRISHRAAFPELRTSQEIALFERIDVRARTLFAMTTHGDTAEHARLADRVQNQARPQHAAIALRSYLTTGEANWTEALQA